MIDAFFEHKRWLRQKEKILSRDLLKDKLALKDKTINMIEGQVDQQRASLSADIKASKAGAKREDLHGKLNEQRAEYARKMKILDEIKSDKASHERQQQDIAEKLAKRQAEQNKFQS